MNTTSLQELLSSLMRTRTVVAHLAHQQARRSYCAPRPLLAALSTTDAEHESGVDGNFVPASGREQRFSGVLLQRQHGVPDRGEDEFKERTYSFREGSAAGKTLPSVTTVLQVGIPHRYHVFGVTVVCDARWRLPVMKKVTVLQPSCNVHILSGFMCVLNCTGIAIDLQK